MARSTDAQVVPDAAGPACGPAIADLALASIDAGARENDRCLDKCECRGRSEASKTLGELELRRASSEGEQERDTAITSKVCEAEERILASSRLVVDATAAKDEAIVFESSLHDGVDALHAGKVVRFGCERGCECFASRVASLWREGCKRCK